MLAAVGALGTSKVDLTLSDDNNTGFKDLTFHWTLANVFPMRLMMQLNGFVENPATMTFNEHDKFRVTWMDSLTRNWMQQTALYGVPNFASIPITKDMNTSQEPTGTLGKSGYILSTERLREVRYSSTTMMGQVASLRTVLWTEMSSRLWRTHSWPPMLTSKTAKSTRFQMSLRLLSR